MNGTQGTSIRWSLLRNLLLLISLLFAALFAVSFLTARQAVRTLCQDLCVRTTDKIEVELQRFFEPVATQLVVVRDWMERGGIVGVQPEQLSGLLQPLLERNPQMSSINTGDEDGRGFMLLQADGEWRERIVDPGRFGSLQTVLWRIWAGGDPTAVREERQEVDYDPRQRPWYVGAKTQLGRSLTWTEPYVFFTTKDPGITASLAVGGPSPLILAADVLLLDISRFTTDLEVSPEGLAVVTTSDGRVIGLPNVPSYRTSDAIKAEVLKPLGELGHEPLAMVTQDAAAAGSPVSFKRGGNRWWRLSRSCQISGGPNLQVVVAVPESDFLGDVRRRRTIYLTLTILAFGVAVLIAQRLAQRYNRPIQTLIEQSQRLQQLDTSAASAPNSGIREIDELSGTQERMRVALDSFARYVPRDVVRELLDNGEAAVIGGRQSSLTMLFTDIKGFTAIAEKMEPDELTAHMAEYFENMLGIITRERGTIDKLVGDAIVAFWGAPSSNQAHAADAVRAVVACRDRMETLNREWQAKGLPPLFTRYGLSTGEVVVGNVGAPDRLSYTVLGDAMNLASRLESANNIYHTEILASARTVEEAGDAFVWRCVDKVRVKGRRTPERIYELLGESGKVPQEILAAKAVYDRAFEAYLRGAFADARQMVSDLDDRASMRLAERCDALLDDPPDGGWDGATDLGSKS